MNVENFYRWVRGVRFCYGRSAVKRVLWAFRFYSGLMGSGLGLVLVAGVVLFQGPPETPVDFPAISAAWMFGSIPWHLACIVGAVQLAWALYLGEDAYKGLDW